ncbi:yemanuclein-like isoform X2 [Contarinia nasturtii]|uniref:yemanuclein-like isoform X2 n=1 Tax=Contarinia nasturtii TaxID=265458 RepID=UPI0012D43BD4|nr:yemanuclein-like isoform X2 [Contarinia nasturtii]
MSEPKRVTFETIPSVSSKNLAADASNSQKIEKTVRLEIKLFEPNKNTYPEFNFKKLCRAEKEKVKVPLPNGFADPLEEADHDAEKLALEFERKYGSAYGGENRPSKGGADKGYDENNGFIDDSEAYDEVIPDEMDTDRGGFYINSGQLQFKKLPSKASKRALASYSEDESDSMSSVSLENGNVSKKQKLSEKDKTLNNKEKKNDLVTKQDKTAIVIETIKNQSVGNKEVKTTSVMHMLQAKRDANLLKSSSHTNKGSKSTSSATSDDSSSSDSDSSDSSSDADPSRNSDDDDFDNVNNKGTENKIQTNGIITTSNNIPHEVDLKFFENLTSNHRDSINRLIDYSKNLKENFFQPETLDLLYGIDKAHQSDSKLLNQIYNHLEQFTSYTKQQLMNEVKDYAVKKSENDVRTQERSLQKDITQIMPSLKEKYDQDSKRIDEQRAAYHGTEKPEQVFKNPRRKFVWNEHLRTKVNEVLRKWQFLYEQKQIRDQTREQYTMSYITDKLVPMWPDGWMKSNDIYNGFMPKVKEPKKSLNDVKTTKLIQPIANAQASIPLLDNPKDGGLVVQNTEKKKSQMQKDSTKLIKNTNDKPTLPKTDKKHNAITADRPAVSPASLLSMPIGDAFNPKTGSIKMPLVVDNASSSATIALKSKQSIASSNGNAVNYGRHLDTNASLEYVSPTKKASDHSISQLILPAPSSNHSSFVPPIKLQTQTLAHTPYDNPTTSSSLSVSNKSTQGSSSKASKLLDGQQHHRPQSSSNGANNNNFLHNNNNSKHTTPQRPIESAAFIDLCDTDDGETTAKKPKQHKHKHNKKSKDSVGSNNVPLTNTVHMLNQMHHQPTSMSINPVAALGEEVDANQIIHDLKRKLL